MTQIYNSVLETIGKTPLIKLSRLTTGAKATILVKLESRNPGGSVKDRICISMVNEAEKQGTHQTRSHHYRAHQWKHRHWLSNGSGC